MLQYWYGNSSYRLKQAVRAATAGAVRFDMTEDTPEALSHELRATSLFDAEKTVIAEHVESADSARLKRALEYADTADDVICVYHGAPKQSDTLHKWLSKIADTTREYALLQGKQCVSWIIEEAERCCASIEEQAAGLLVERIGTDDWQLANTVHKLAAATSDGVITKTAVEAEVPAPFTEKVFSALDALAEGRRDAALGKLQGHLASGESPLKLLAMVAWQLRQLMSVKELLDAGYSVQEICRMTGQKQFLVKKSAALARRFSRGELRRAYARLLQYDVSIKQGRMMPETALELFVAYR